MRFFCLLFITFFLFTSCSEDTHVDENNVLCQNSVKCSIRSYNDALKIAQRSIILIDEDATRANGSLRQIDINDSKKCVIDASTRAMSNDNDTLMYVFNFKDNKGFAIVSACNYTEDLIAVTSSGNYDPNEESENKGFDLYVDMASDYIKNAKSSHIVSDSVGFTKMKVTADTTDYKVGNFIDVTCGQNWPEGLYCSNNTCGCTITAMAQIMSYLENPQNISLTYENDYNAETLSLNWDEMKKHKRTHSKFLFDDTSEEAHLSIAHLCRQLGFLCDSQYNSDGTTSTYITDAQDTFKSLGFMTEGWNDYNSQNVYNALEKKHTVMMSGQRKTSTGYSGHSWVIDGFLKRIINVTYWTKKDIEFNWTLNNENQSVYNYSHINWGWNGDCNGYLSVGYI